jgi:hypothetical protein
MKERGKDQEREKIFFKLQSKWVNYIQKGEKRLVSK